MKAALPAFIGTAVFDWGHLGVALFFVLSGFVMAHTVRKYDFTGQFGARFMARRLARLTPPYHASIIFVLAYILLKSAVMSEPAPFPSMTVLTAHAFYLQDILRMEPISVVYWTLCIEIQFYIAFIAMMLAQRRIRTAIAISSIGALPWAFGLIGPLYVGSFLPFWSCFMLGVLISVRSYWRWIYAAVLTVAAVATANAVLFAALGAAALIDAGRGFSTVARVLSVGPLRFLGAVSYSLYLFHNQIAGAADFLLKSFLPSSVLGDAARLMIIVIACLCGAYIVYRLVEKPSIDLSRKVRVTSPSVAYKTGIG